MLSAAIRADTDSILVGPLLAPALIHASVPALPCGALRTLQSLFRPHPRRPLVPVAGLVRLNAAHLFPVLVPARPPLRGPPSRSLHLLHPRPHLPNPMAPFGSALAVAPASIATTVDTRMRLIPTAIFWSALFLHPARTLPRWPCRIRILTRRLLLRPRRPWLTFHPLRIPARMPPPLLSLRDIWRRSRVSTFRRIRATVPK